MESDAALAIIETDCSPLAFGFIEKLIGFGVGASVSPAPTTSGGPSGKDDLHQAVRTAVINKRAGGMGLISGRKAFQKPMDEGVNLLNSIQDVYLSSDVTIA